MPEPNISEQIEEPSMIDLKTDLVKALTRSDENFRALVELLPASLMVHRGGKIIYVNPSWLRLLGYDRPEEFIGQGPLFFVHPDFQKTIKDRINHIAGGLSGTPLFEQVWIRKNGDSVPVEAEGVSVAYQGVPAVMVIAQDISARKKAQEGQLQSEQSLKTIIEQIPDGIVVNDPGRILLVNKRLVEMLGYDRAEELMGRSPLEHIHPDYRAIARDRIGRVFREGARNPIWEYKWIKKDGTPIDVEVSGLSIVYQGQKAVMAIVRDITERKKAQEELMESHFLLEKAQQAGHVGTWIADLRPGGAAVWSKESYSIFGVEEGKFASNPENFFSLLHPEDRELLFKANSTAIEKGTGFDLEFRIVRPDKAIRWVHSRSEVIHDSDGNSIKLIGTTQDVTDRKKAEQDRREVERQALFTDKLTTIGTLAAGVAHEINNPLTYVLANIGFAKENLAELRDYLGQKSMLDSKAFNLLNELKEEVLETHKGMDRIRDIVRGLKTFVRSDEEEISEIDVNDLVESALNLVFHEIKHKAKIEKDYILNPPHLRINGGKLQQVLINLLINAAQSIPPNKGESNKIRIRTGWGGENVFIEIEDTGGGIPEENLKKIFNPFFTTKPVGVGTGLGLSICQQIIEGYKGSIQVRTEVGKGSVFTVCLPMGRAAEIPVKTAGPPSGGHQGKRILIVDDEPANVETFARMLRDDHKVMFASSGLDALKVVEREKGQFDVIVSDVFMPDLDGLGLYRAIAGRYPGLEKKMVFVTGGIFNKETRDFLKSLPNPLLEKPFPMSKLLEAISGLLENQAA